MTTITTETNPSPLRVERERHPFAARHLQLLKRAATSPGFVRVTLGGPELAGFISTGFDDHLKFILPQHGLERPNLPRIVDGRPSFEGERPTTRDYTPLRYDLERNELEIEFALHNTGPAADWAKNAPLGQWVGVAGPRGSMLVPKEFEWHWLLGDDSALPAIERRLAELPATARATVRIQVADVRDQRALPSAARVDLQWVDSLTAAAEPLALPAGDGFIWAAGEHNEMAALRRVVLAKPGVDPKRMRIAAYWKRGEIAHHAELNEA